MLLGTMYDLFDPFLDESINLYAIDTKVVGEKNVIVKLIQAEDNGKKQLIEFVKAGLHQPKCPITNITHKKKQFKRFQNKKTSFLVKETRKTKNGEKHCSITFTNV